MPDAPISRLPCIEPGCDRPAAVGDARCELHASRLGPIPRAHSAPPVASVPKVLDVSPASPLSSWREQRFSGRFAVASAAIATVFLVVGTVLIDVVPSTSTLAGQLALAGLVIAALVAPAASIFSLRAASTTPRKVVATIALLLALAPWLLLGAAVLGL